METSDIYTVLPEVLHENEHYTVHSVASNNPFDIPIIDGSGCAYDHGYGVISKQTGQIELVRVALVDALYNAEHLARIVTEKPYLWMNKEKEDEPEESATNGIEFFDLN